MNDVQWGIIWKYIKQKECPTCKVMCQIRNLSIDELNTKRKQKYYPKRFDLIEKNNSCTNITS